MKKKIVALVLVLSALLILMCAAALAEKAMFPFHGNVTISQGFGPGAASDGGYEHKNLRAVDYRGQILLYAPFDLSVAWCPGDHRIVFQSVNPVQLANGQTSYVCLFVGHCDNIGEFGLTYGKTFKQGEPCYRGGSTGYATGAHVHMEVSLGIYNNGIYWDSSGHLTNQASPDQVFFVNRSVTPSISDPGNNFQWVEVIGGQGMTQGYDRCLPDGDYMIVTAGNDYKAEFYYLDINGVDLPATSETNVILTGPERDDAIPADIWTLTYDSASKFYTIKQKGADIALEIGEGDIERNKYEGANVRVYTANSSVAQQWAITHNGKDGYLVQAACSGMVLDITGGSVVNGANIQQFTNNGKGTQSWLFIPYKPAQTLANGRYTIVSEVDKSFGFYVPGGSGVEENQTVQIWKTASLDSQYNVFDITKLDNGYYKIIHVASGKALEVYRGKSTTAEDDEVTLHEWNGTNPQQWAIMKNGYNGGYTLWCRSSGYLIDLVRRETGNGKQLHQYIWNTGGALKGDDIVSSAMTWRFVVATTERGELVLPSNLRRIGVEAFAGIKASMVRIPMGCMSIGTGAFKNCRNLIAVYIPTTVSDIADDAFEGCANVVIYGKSGSEAIQYAQRMGLAYTLN